MPTKQPKKDSNELRIENIVNTFQGYDEMYKGVLDGAQVFNSNDLKGAALYFVRETIPRTGNRHNDVTLLDHMGQLLDFEAKGYNRHLENFEKEGIDRKPSTIGFEFVGYLFRSGFLDQLYVLTDDQRVIDDYIMETRDKFIGYKLSEATSKDPKLLNGDDAEKKMAEDAKNQADEFKNRTNSFMNLENFSAAGTGGIDRLNELKAHYTEKDSNARKSKLGLIGTIAVAVAVAGTALVTYEIMGGGVEDEKSHVESLKVQADQVPGLNAEINKLESQLQDYQERDVFLQYTSATNDAVRSYVFDDLFLASVDHVIVEDSAGACKIALAGGIGKESYIDALELCTNELNSTVEDNRNDHPYVKLTPNGAQ